MRHYGPVDRVQGLQRAISVALSASVMMIIITDMGNSLR